MLLSSIATEQHGVRDIFSSEIVTGCSQYKLDYGQSFEQVVNRHVGQNEVDRC